MFSTLIKKEPIHKTMKKREKNPVLEEKIEKDLKIKPNKKNKTLKIMFEGIKEPKEPKEQKEPKEPKNDKKSKIKEHIQEFKTKGLSFLNTLNEDNLTQMIVISNDAYYNTKKSLMTDNEYDILREYIMNKYPENTIVKNIGAPITKNKVTLPYNMPSMDKIKPDTNALSNWMVKYKGPYVLSCKLDGVSGMYSTEGEIPKLYTRGDGKVGQDVSHLLRVLNLPQKKTGEQGIVVRGEFIIPKNVFKEKYSQQFANPRNLVSGIVNSKTIDEKTQDLHFVTYEVIHPPMNIGEQIELLNRIGYEVVQNRKEDFLSNEMLSTTLMDWRTNYEYEVDGIIVTDDNLHPRKDGNPEYAFAFKMVISDQMAEAKVLDVIWEPSKSGYLKPRVQIEPIQLGGVTIQYATGFNGEFIEKNKIGIGAVIQIIRSGDVIPHIKSVTTPAENPKMPEQSYKWTKNHVDIVLDNFETDTTVIRKNITEFFTKLDVDGLSGKTVEKIMDTGLDTIPKILKATKEDFAKVKGFKQTMIDKIYNGIKTQIEKAELVDIMIASNQFGRGIGEQKLKLILNTESNILTSQESLEEKYEKLIRIKGIGIENAKSFTENLSKFLDFLRECGLEGKLVSIPIQNTMRPIDINTSHPLYGKRIVMTNIRDAIIKEKLEKVGGILDDKISKNTFLLIVKSKQDETSKSKYAKEHNIEIMEPEEFLLRFF
jgi:DNA ligase (NAD+)